MSARLPLAALSPDCSLCVTHGECVIGAMPPAERGRYAPLVRERPFAKGDVLLREGEVVTRFRVVKVGLTQLLRRGPDGRNRPVALFGIGQVLGKFGLVGQPNALTCIALTSGRLCEMRVSDIEAHGLWSEPFRNQLGLAYVRSYGRMADWAQVMRIPGVQRQLAAVLLLLAQAQRSRLLRLPPHTVLGQLLGARRETVARAMAALERRKAFSRRDRWHCDIDEAVLRTQMQAL